MPRGKWSRSLSIALTCPFAGPTVNKKPPANISTLGNHFPGPNRIRDFFQGLFLNSPPSVKQPGNRRERERARIPPPVWSSSTSRKLGNGGSQTGAVPSLEKLRNGGTKKKMWSLSRLSLRAEEEGGEYLIKRKSRRRRSNSTVVSRMDEENYSWVRGAKFSHSVCHRVGSSKLPAIPTTVRPLWQNSDKDFNSPSKAKPAVSSSKNFHSTKEFNSPPKAKPVESSSKHFQRSSYSDGPGYSGRSSLLAGRRREERSLSPMHNRTVSEVFREARSETKRFSTPAPPRRKDYEKSFTGRLFSSAKDSPSRKIDKSKSQRESGKVTSVETMEEWKGDLSQLYLGHKFASGAHSKVYHGVYKEAPVAVKVITQPEGEENAVLAAKLEKQFTREVTHLSHFSHRNVIKLVAACRAPSVFCIITEYLDGGSLRSILHKQKNESLPLDRIISISLQIAKGMEYIHSQGVIHRDLKPENVLFDEESCVKIADFGIACEAAYCEPLTEDPGTYRWMAPEMIKHKPYGHKVDVYSFGLLIWEMLTGKVPFEDMTPIQAAFAVVDKNIRPSIPSSCPIPLKSLIEQCWSLLPEKRPDFYQIVKLLEQMESSITKNGNLNLVQHATCQEHKSRLVQWIHKLKPLISDDGPRTPPPRFL